LRKKDEGKLRKKDEGKTLSYQHWMKRQDKTTLKFYTLHIGNIVSGTRYDINPILSADNQI